MERKIKICLGLLSNRGFRNKTVISLLNMVNQSQEFDWFIIESINGYTISENRNWLSAQAVKNGCDYLLMIDDDMVFAPDTARIMVSRNKDIIGVPFHTRVFPKKITVLPVEGSVWSETEANEVLAVGAGIILIKTDVFKKLSQPWFDVDKHENGMAKVGEDYWFCNKAYANGYKIFCEPTIKELGHLGEYMY